MTSIALIVEGATERALLPQLRRFLETRLPGRMPRLRSFAQDGLIPTGDKLARLVDNLFADGYDVVIAITDVYTGTGQFVDSQDANGLAPL